MKNIKLAAVLLFSGLMFITGCDGCYDEELIDNAVLTPNFSLVRGTNYTVEISSKTEGASIRYTVDGNDPKISGTAADGNSADIDYFTEIKAYAYKDGMLASDVACYRLPTFDRTVNVRYKADPFMYVDYYSYSELDGNENKKIEVTLNGKGADLIWFTDDDTVSDYHLFLYDDTGLIQENVYSASGADGEWFTSDDVRDGYFLYIYNEGVLESKEYYYNSGELQNYWEYSYDAGKLSYIRKYNAADELQEVVNNIYTGDDLTLVKNLDPTDEVTALGSVEYAYSDDKLDSATEKDGTGTDIAFSKYYYDNIKEYSVFTYNTDDTLQKETKYKGYGADTEFSVTEYTYTEGVLIATAEYEDVAKTRCKSYVEYFYNKDEDLSSEVYYSSPGKENELYSYSYNYDEAGILTSKDKYDPDDYRIEYTSYIYDEDGKKTEEILYVKPDPNSFTITLNLTVSLGYINGGYYASAGVNYDYEGVPAGSIINIGSDQAEMIQNIITELMNIYDNLEITDNGIIITGSESGRILITVRAVDYTITVNYDFQSYNNGDITVDGEVTKVLEGTIDLSGELSGTLNGEMTGTLTITDADPVWSNDEYLINAITVFEYNPVTELLSKEKYFVDAGADGDWETIADNNQKSLTEYYYDGSNTLTEIRFYKGEGPATKCETSYDITDYRLVFIYDSGLKTRADKYCEYGTYIKTFSDAGDGDWETIEDNVFDYSSLTYFEK